MAVRAIGRTLGSVLISVQNRLSKKSGHGKRLILEVDLLTKECTTTTRTKRTAKPRQIEALIGSDRGLLKELMKEALQEVLEAEMTEALGAGPGERTADRVGYRSGYYSRGLVTRIGKFRAPDIRL